MTNPNVITDHVRERLDIFVRRYGEARSHHDPDWSQRQLDLIRQELRLFWLTKDEVCQKLGIEVYP